MRFRDLPIAPAHQTTISNLYHRCGLFLEGANFYVAAKTDDALCEVLMVRPTTIPQFVGRDFWDVTVWNTESGLIEDWLVRGDATAMITREGEPL